MNWYSLDHKQAFSAGELGGCLTRLFFSISFTEKFTELLKTATKLLCADEDVLGVYLKSDCYMQVVVKVYICETGPRSTTLEYTQNISMYSCSVAENHLLCKPPPGYEVSASQACLKNS